MTKPPRSILIADDEPGLRDLYHFALEPLGYEVVTVADGLAAVEALEVRAFDLVILDVHMPRLGGPEALTRIRAFRPEQRVLVVSSSSDAEHEAEERIRREAGIECLYKPLSLDEMTTAIEQALNEAPRGGS